MRRAAGTGWAAALAASAAACGGAGEGEVDLDALRAEVAALRDSASAAAGLDSLSADAAMDSAGLVVGLASDLVRDVLARSASLYLADVRLHLDRDVVITQQNDVVVKLGPLSVSAGTWRLRVTLDRIDARLRVDSVVLGPAEPGRIAVSVPVAVEEGTGEAVIEFEWDAARATSVVCGDFSVRERFSGYVEPRVYRIEGAFVLERSGSSIVARPEVEGRIPVSPRPTEESWRRVRAILEAQDRIFECGLALSPEDMEERLRSLLLEGFRFDLPSQILRPLPLPASVADTVTVAGRRVRLGVRGRPPRMTGSWLWLAADVDAEVR